MNLGQRIFQSVVLGLVALAMAGCGNVPWRFADSSVEAAAQLVAERAAANDVAYFTSISPAPERVRELIRQIERSGLATDYSRHLKMESSTRGTLAYGVMGDPTPGTSFAIQLSLVNGKARIDQIVLYRKGEAGYTQVDSAGAAAAKPAALSPNPVTMSVSRDGVIAGGEEIVLFSHRNISNKPAVVALPLKVALRITQLDNTPVMSARSPGRQGPQEHVVLAPWESVYSSVRFTAPGPGDYNLYGSVNGMYAPAASLHVDGTN